MQEKVAGQPRGASAGFLDISLALNLAAICFQRRLDPIQLPLPISVTVPGLIVDRDEGQLSVGPVADWRDTYDFCSNILTFPYI